ncbi:hypothetical protein GLOTRDRAFT_139526 [Gloeophyllum trabeum ATCC 11539]|uniref:Uncharacterized protein n=1 Tax=Gloeophyllum trabeum (strain ATCC 11539 / FP-39264 / Madison 617) TaxID=670483 RepID=S7RIJ0_GLOTA|nr:uncharacterized protein GLOTRDRAFT_139526 [Gloeophyllum trabeum ATCC 11539]EPQ54145.1 hypothetical protein GLOTRDRAFT_139526 [Gloeophyllum trabeum ATCC 11539]
MLSHIFWFLFALLSYVGAQQTLTIPDPDNPLTSIVEVITVTQDAEGLLTTETLETLPLTNTRTRTTATTDTTTTTPTLATTTTTTPVPQVVGQPGPSPATGAIPYQYTTVVAGATQVIQDTYTPTFPVITPVIPTSTGTVLDYSQWLSMVGTNTVASEKIAGATGTWRPSAPFWGVAVGGLVCLCSSVRLLV